MSKPKVNAQGSRIVRVTVTGSDSSTASGAWAALAEARAALQGLVARMAAAVAASTRLPG